MSTSITIEKASRVRVQTIGAKLLDVPPNFFAISMGLAGLAAVWRLAASLYSWPLRISDALYLVAASVYLILVVAFLAKLVLKPTRVLAALRHPIVGPFNALLPLSGIVLSLGLQTYLPDLARIMFLLFFFATLLLGAWLSSEWLIISNDIAQFHPGYFLPTVAGGLIGADGAARFGLINLGWMSFGIGLISYLALNSIIFVRLLFYPTLPSRLVPLLAIMLAPPVLGGSAYFNLSGGKLDPLALMLFGYSLLMLLVQLSLLPLYLKAGFGIGWWSFAFVYAAAAGFIIRWLKLSQLEWAEGLTYLILGSITLLIGVIAARSLLLFWQSFFKTGPQSVGAES